MKERRLAYRRAAIVGGSMAGMTAAAALWPHFEEIVLFDRDRFPEAPGYRKAVPQAHHIHNLHAGGNRTLETLLPGFNAVARDAGAVPTDPTRDVRGYLPSGQDRDRFESGLTTVLASRNLIEWTVRRLTRDLSGVVFREAAAVAGLLATGDRERVVGVLLENGERVPADLVVDAGGRGSRGPRWLAELGYTQPEEVFVDAHWGYSSRAFRFPSGFEPGWLGIGSMPRGKAATTADRSRGATLIRRERGEWILTLWGTERDYPPIEQDSAEAFLGSQTWPESAGLLRGAVPVDPGFTASRSTINRLRRYDLLPALPRGLVFIGDAVVATNPAYGFGMTTAAICAAALGELVADLRERGDEDLSELAPRFQRALRARAEYHWWTATDNDRRMPGVDGAPPEPAQAERRAFFDVVVELGREDPGLHRKILETQFALRDLGWLDDPELIERVNARRGAAKA